MQVFPYHLSAYKSQSLMSDVMQAQTMGTGTSAGHDVGFMFETAGDR